MPYRKISTVLALLFLIGAISYSQEAVFTMLPYNGDTLRYVDKQFIADTTATGGLLANRVYEFKRDSVYLTHAILTIQTGRTLRLRATGTGTKKPIIYLWEAGTGATPTRPPGNFVVLNGGNLEMKNICIAGYYEPEPDRVGGVQGGLVNTTAAGSSIILDGVVLSNVNGQHIRTGFNAVKVSATNCIFANMGALTTSNLGAGKGFDLREAAVDTFVLVNNTFVNYQDRAVRHYNFANPAAGTGVIRYGRIQHNTFVNGMGYHGLLSLGNVGDLMIIADNLFVDAFGLGEDSTDATRAAEWANTGEFYPNGRSRINWIFSAPNQNTAWWIGKNWYAISDSGLAFLNSFNYPIGSPLSWHINSRLQAQGGDSVNAFKRDTLALTKVPRLMTNMMRWYEDPAGGMRQKVQTNFVLARDDFDRRRIEYYRDSLDASYTTATAAYTGATGGYPAGDLNWFPSQKTAWLADPISGVEGPGSVIPEEFALDQNYPNPFNPATRITYSVPKQTKVVLEVFDLLGRKVTTLVDEIRPAGTFTVDFDGSRLVSGVYFYRLSTPYQVFAKKMLLIK
jgi:hypothetical protein